jgi:uncharacterized protein
MKQTALITGASSGIGLELARVFARNGYNLVLVARSRDKLLAISKELTNQYTSKVDIITADLSAHSASTLVYNEIKQLGIEIDVLVNNAGVGLYGEFLNQSWDSLDKMIMLNMHTLTHLTHLFLPSMVSRKRGKIIQIASTAAFQPGPTMAVYYATKSYVLGFSAALQHELKGTGVTVTTICPGPTISGFQDAADMKESRLFRMMPIPGSDEVAEFSYKMAMKGKTVAIHGLLNRIMAFSTRLMPRRLLMTVAKSIMAK